MTYRYTFSEIIISVFQIIVCFGSKISTAGGDADKANLHKERLVFLGKDLGIKIYASGKGFFGDKALSFISYRLQNSSVHFLETDLVYTSILKKAFSHFKSYKVGAEGNGFGIKTLNYRFKLSDRAAATVNTGIYHRFLCLKSLGTELTLENTAKLVTGVILKNERKVVTSVLERLEKRIVVGGCSNEGEVGDRYALGTALGHIAKYAIIEDRKQS